jgi:hypothetical protein
MAQRKREIQQCFKGFSRLVPFTFRHRVLTVQKVLRRLQKSRALPTLLINQHDTLLS